MISYFAGPLLVDVNEYFDRVSRGDISDLVEQNNPDAKLAFRYGEVTLRDLTNARNGFDPIGIGKPLTVRLFTAYVGELRGRRKDILITSSIKNAYTFAEATRMMNLVDQKVPDRQHAQWRATSKGSPYVHHTKSLVDDDTLLTFELIPDDFNAELVGQIGSLFSRAAGLPVFAISPVYQGWLLAGSVLTRIFKALGESFLESAAIIQETLKLTFGVPGLPDFEQGAYVVFNDGHRDDFAQYLPKYSDVQRRWQMENKDSEEYLGEAPYMILGIDGRENSRLEKFEPTLATAAALEKYFPKAGGLGPVVDQLEAALELYNDMKNREEALKLKARLEKLDPTSDEWKKLKTVFDAHNKAIRNELFKVEEPSNTPDDDDS